MKNTLEFIQIHVKSKEWRIANTQHIETRRFLDDHDTLKGPLSRNVLSSKPKHLERKPSHTVRVQARLRTSSESRLAGAGLDLHVLWCLVVL